MEDYTDILREIKADLRANMNGVASAKMREAGLQYHVNFGVELPRLQQIADDVRSRLSPSHPLTSSPSGNSGEYGDSRKAVPQPLLSGLSQSLWHENVRESKILAAMLMPAGHFPPELAGLWAEQIPNAEIAQTTVMFLFARLPFADTLVFPWLASERTVLQLCALLLATRLIIQGTAFSDADHAELLDQARSLAHPTAPLAIRKAAHNLLLRLE